MLNPESGNIFALIFTISKNLISFSETLYQFMTQPIGETIYMPFEPFYDIPIIGSMLEGMMNVSRFVLPYSPMTILSGTGLFIILALVLVKKLIPTA